MWNSDPKHVINGIPNFTKPDNEDQWNQILKLEDDMDANFFNSSICTCCGYRRPRNIMRIGLIDTIHPNILELLISSET